MDSTENTGCTEALNHPSICFATAFQHVVGTAPNAKTRDDSAKFEIYYKCICVCFLSLRRLYPTQRLVVVTDRKLPEFYSNILAELKTEQVIIEDSVTNLTSSFPGCLFTLSLLGQFDKIVDKNNDDLLVILDSDCIFRGPIGNFLCTIKGGVGAYPVGYALNRDINGNSVASLTLMRDAIVGLSFTKPITYYGGEFYAIPVPVLDLVRDLVSSTLIWIEDNRHYFGQKFTEEHILSIVLNSLPETIPVIDASVVIKRIWTSYVYNNVTGNDVDIPIWHLPAEKKRSFVKLFDYAIKNKLFRLQSNSVQLQFEDVLRHKIPVAYGKQVNIVFRGLYLFIKGLKSIFTEIKSLFRDS